jgi:preprotein translocase subunit SecF
VTFIALLFSLSSHVTLALFASLLSFIAALLTLIAFAIDIALYIIVHDRVQRLQDGQTRSVAAPGMAKPLLLFPLSV